MRLRVEVKYKRDEKTMFDVVDRAREALENDETITSEILQQFATDTKEIEATKDVRHTLKRIQ